MGMGPTLPYGSQYLIQPSHHGHNFSSELHHNGVPNTRYLSNLQLCYILSEFVKSEVFSHGGSETTITQ